jgi:peptidoglycan/LPS O-acetylase OafA/YrhL
MCGTDAECASLAVRALGFDTVEDLSAFIVILAVLSAAAAACVFYGLGLLVEWVCERAADRWEDRRAAREARMAAAWAARRSEPGPAAEPADWPVF